MNRCRCLRGPGSRLFSQSTSTPFSGALAANELEASPLDELRSRSARRGLCSEEGFRLPGAPWGMQLAHASSNGDPWPVVRTIGFQAVRPDGFTFLLKRHTKLSAKRLPIAMTYVEGRYAKGDVCEQWRAEGIAEEVPADDVLKTAPPASFAQILAAGSVVEGGGEADGAAGQRSALVDREAFVAVTAGLKQRLVAGEVQREELRGSVIVYRVVPQRMEMLIGGPDFPMWERFEWRSLGPGTGGGWSGPSRIVPY